MSACLEGQPLNLDIPLLFQLSGLDTSDSFEPLELVVGHPMPASAKHHGLCLPRAGGPGLICIVN